MSDRTVSGEYRCIVADPPWPINWKPSLAAPTSRAKGRQFVRELPYETMSLEQIEGLLVPAAPDAHLYLWTPDRFVEAAYAVARSWGFAPSKLLTWCKSPMGIGLGGTFTQTTEYVLFSRRGSLSAKTRIDTTWFSWPRIVEHSRKPDAFLDLVELVSPGPYLELFARRQRLGWDTWGNEALEHVAL
jgi:N6-adenosine-specific RNA methylase IME4